MALAEIYIEIKVPVTILTFTILWAISADDKFLIGFLILFRK